MDIHYPYSCSRFVFYLVATLLLLPLTNVHAFNYGKIDSSQGVACNACHNGGIAPVVNITGPVDVVPGSVNRYTLTISGGQQNQGGFNVSGTGGVFSTVSPGTWLTNNQLHHYVPAVANANGVISWEFDWQAPASDSTHVLYGAGLSTNASGSEVGDAAATTSLTITVGTGGSAPPPSETGESLYISNCQSCHGAPPGPKAGRTATQIQTAISNNTGGMGSLSVLSAAQVQLVADFLGGGNNTPQAPVADAGGPYTAVLGTQILFDGTASSDADGSVVSYSWDFGDGNTATGATPGHTYTAIGLYTVTLTVTDNSNMTGSITTTANVAADVPPPPVYDGAALYGTNCSGCHGVLSNSGKAGRTAAQIQNAINNNVGGMGNANLGLIDLIPAEVQAIADALAGGSNTPQAPVADPGAAYNGVVGTAIQFDGSGSIDADGTIVAYAWDFGDGNVGTGVSPSHTYTSSGLFTVSLTVTDNDNLTGSSNTTANIGTNIPPPPVLDGLALYNQNCSGCHGAAPGSKAGRTASQIQNSIDLVQAMSGLSNLTAEEVQAIADAISTGGSPPPATGGEGLYNQYCSSCHGAEGKGGAEGDVTGESADSIQDAIDKEEDMQYLANLLSDDDIAQISAYLSGTSGFIEVSKESQYDLYCAACHGPEGRGGAEGDVRGERFSDIKDAISKEQEMNYLASLSDEVAQAIADFLNGDNGTILIPAPSQGGGSSGYVEATKESQYDLYCAACHGVEGRGGAEGDVRGENFSGIKDAIVKEQEMNYLVNLSDEVVQAIADYLNGDNGTILIPAPSQGGGGGGGTPDGLALYGTNCAGCHGAAPGSKADRTASQIQTAINNVGSMSGLTGLTAAEVQAIADAIATGGGGGGGGGGGSPPDGLTLYATNCEGCHGAAPGSKADRSASQIQTAINNVGSMSGLTGLTTAEVQAIADAIVTGGGGGGGGGGGSPSDGLTLYANNCAGCHGAAPGSKAGRSASQIQTAINNVGDMSGLTGLTAAEVQAIADATGGSNAPPPPTTPEGLYATYCSACHGAEGRGGDGGDIRGSSSSDISKAIDKESDMNYLSALLADSSIQSIAEFLNNGSNSKEGSSDRRRRESGQLSGAGTPSGGGCSVRSDTPFDPLLPMLFIFSAFYMARRRRSLKTL